MLLAIKRTVLAATAFGSSVLVVACAGEERPVEGGYGGSARQAESMVDLPSGVYAMSQIQIIDPNGFDRPMVAATALIPAGWRSEGIIAWGPHGQCGSDYATKWQAVSPDGALSFAMTPMPNWAGLRSEYPAGAANPCGEAFYASVREYLEASARQMFPDARILDYRSLDDEIRPLREVIAESPPIQDQSMRTQMVAEAGELLIAFTENGRDMRGAVSATALITRVQLADMMQPRRIVMESVNGYPSNFTVVKAPNGRLDLNLRRRIVTSARFAPEWSRAISAYHARNHKSHMEASKAAHAARMDAIRATSDIINGAYENRQIVNDRLHRETIEAIRGVETYHDPVAGQPVQLDNTYNHAWRVNGADNTYILTNDVNFNPGTYSIDAQELRPLE